MIKLTETIFASVALGFIYALVALGFVIIYKASEVINFAHGAIMLLGSYLVFQFTVVYGIQFGLAVLISMALMAVLGILIERFIIGRMIGEPVFAIVMITLGLEVIIRTVVVGWYGKDFVAIGDPWGFETISVGSMRFSQASIAAIIAGIVLLGAFFVFFKFSRTGTSMKAASVDQEAALAMGINVRRVFAISWAIAGALAAVGGVFVATTAGARPGTLDEANAFIALRAFPAAILGGLDSPGGAVVGGLVIGFVEVFAGAYLVGATWGFLGDGFANVLPYIVMVLVLLFRPYGLFGTREIERV